LPNGFTIPTIMIDGRALEPSFALLGIDVTHAVNRIPAALVFVQAPGPVLGETPLMAGGPFAPASEVEIKLQDSEGDDVSVFKGVVTALTIHTRDGVPTLEVTIKDKAVRLTGARHSRIWADTTDTDAIQDIVEAASLTLGDAPDTQPTHKTLVQYECTDWDFILSRADAHSLVVVVQDGKVSLTKMEVADAARTFSRDLDDIADIHFEFDAATQMPSLSGIVWDPDKLAAAEPADADLLNLPQGDIARNIVGEALGVGPAHLSHMVPLPASEAKAWATSRMARARLALIRGRISLPGVPDILPAETAKLTGFGDQLDGNALISGVRHRLDSDGFTTDLEFGLAPEPVGRLPELATMPAGGLLPPISDLQLGTVHDTDDPDGQGRVQLTVPAIATDTAGLLWARVASPDAGNKRGFCFMPEKGDEVLVGFLAGDPRHPVVIGRLHGSKNVRPDGFKDTSKKGIISKRDARLVFSEAEQPSVTISTPGGRTVALDDDGKTITITDKNNNKITLDANGITIASGKDLTLKASGAVKVTGSTIDLN